MKCTLHIVLCKEKPKNLINVSGPVSVILRPWNVYKVQLTNISSAGILLVLVRSKKNNKNTSVCLASN